MSKKNYSVARVVTHTQSSIGKCERHNERKNESYANMYVDTARCDMNVHFKSCGELTYNEQLNKLLAEKKVCMRGLKADAKVFDEVIFDVNTDYFETHGGYEYAKDFYEEAYRFAAALYGEQNIISAVMHADELNVALTEQYGKPVYHYHMHLVALPVVEKNILWTKRCKDLCYMFETLQKREKKATLEWINRRGSRVKEKIKSKIIETDDEDGCELFGNVENMPDSYVDVQLSGGDLQDFLSFGNSKKWNKPYTDLLSEWNTSIDPTNIFDEDSEPF